MTCKINHDDPEDIPRALCRQCHPGLSPSPTERAALDRADVERYAKAEALRIKERAIMSLDNKIASMVRKGEPLEGSVPAKILASLRKKRIKLEAA